MPRSNPVQINLISEYTGHTGSVFAMVVDELEAYVYTSGDDGMVVQWDLYRPNSDGKALFRTDRSVYALTLADDRQLLLAGASDGTIYAFHLGQNRLIHTYRKTTAAIYSLWVDHERGLLWSLQAEGALSVIELDDFEEKGYLRPSKANLRALVPDPDGQHYYLASSDHHIHVLNNQTGKVMTKWHAHDNSVFALQIHHGAKYLLSGGRDAHLAIWDMQQDYRLVKRIPAHNFTINGIALSPQEDFFITASRDKTLKLWDAYNFELLKVVDFARNGGHKHSVNRVYWLKRDQTVMSCSDDRRILRWKIEMLDG